MMLSIRPEGARAGLIAFLVAGDPSLEASERYAHALLEEGVSALEIGVPFSDALADGPVIQAAYERALQHDVSLADVLDLVARLRRKHAAPIVVFSYLNPILQMGFEEYARRAKASGVSGTLIVDLPPEEADEHCRRHRECGLDTVFLASPTTSAERLMRIAEKSTGFIYYVSRTGVTGVQNELSRTLETEIAQIRARTRQPIAVGFGIKNGEQAAQVAQWADAVVVGSAFVQLVAENPDPAQAEAKLRARARELLVSVGIVR